MCFIRGEELAGVGGRADHDGRRLLVWEVTSGCFVRPGVYLSIDRLFHGAFVAPHPCRPLLDPSLGLLPCSRSSRHGLVFHC
jgi:hypothetical protein